MSFTYGRALRCTIFGESHGSGVGVVIDGLPPGFKIDWEHLDLHMQRRQPAAAGSTSRREEDSIEVITGLFNNHTTLSPLVLFIKNNDADSSAYTALKNTPRPGHADYAAYLKSGGWHDYRGGGSFSGRLTAPFTAAGALARQFLLQTYNIHIGSHITQLENIHAPLWHYPQPDIHTVQACGRDPFPVTDSMTKEAMLKLMAEAARAGDSLGGQIEAAAVNLRGGLGQGFFGGLESELSKILFAIPAVKAVEFGGGVHLASMRGSMANDKLFFNEDKVISAETNYAGGINGGISNGFPLITRVTFKPASSIALSQQTVNLETGNNEEITIKGRHDSTIISRAAVVVESALALGLTDMLLCRNGEHG
jgi:chorismate synthase